MSFITKVSSCLFGGLECSVEYFYRTETSCVSTNLVGAQRTNEFEVTGGRPGRRKKPSDDSGDDEDWTLPSHQVSNLVRACSCARAGGGGGGGGGRRRDSGESPNAARKIRRARSSSDNRNLPTLWNPRMIISWLIDNNVVA
ncbi:hypothetical protein AAHE18_01G009200 [Arachis hypogaea]|nr:uncharacterized protein DS421_1g01100 [Arachis hypogaea]